MASGTVSSSGKQGEYGSTTVTLDGTQLNPAGAGSFTSYNDSNARKHSTVVSSTAQLQIDGGKASGLEVQYMFTEEGREVGKDSSNPLLRGARGLLGFGTIPDRYRSGKAQRTARWAIRWARAVA